MTGPPTAGPDPPLPSSHIENSWEYIYITSPAKNCVYLVSTYYPMVSVSSALCCICFLVSATICYTLCRVAFSCCRSSKKRSPRYTVEHQKLQSEIEMSRV